MSCSRTELILQLRMMNGLHYACHFGYKDVAELLLKNGADINAKEETDSTVLHLASSNGHKDVAELLLMNGADINAKEESGWTALDCACRFGYKDIAEVLLLHGADVGAKNEDLRTPLDVLLLNPLIKWSAKDLLMGVLKKLGLPSVDISDEDHEITAQSFKDVVRTKLISFLETE